MRKTIKRSFYNEIKKIVGKNRCLSTMEDRYCYSYDATRRSYVPDIVVFPRTAEQISNLVKLAGAEKISIYPRGAGTGFSGGSLPVTGGMVLVFTEMNRIHSISKNERVALVEPGVVVGTLQSEVESEGLFYPPDPASGPFCTLGGNVAENSGGPRAIKYGVTKDYVLGLEVVLPTGDVMTVGKLDKQHINEWDLTSIFVGSEGTLGIITKILLKLLRLPEYKATMRAVYESIEKAAMSVSTIIASKILPSKLEFMDKLSIQCVEEYTHVGLPKGAEALLLIEVDGDRDVVEGEVKEIEKICHQVGAIEFRKAQTQEEEERLWFARRSLSSALSRVNNTKINEDITVPRSKISEILLRLREIADKYHQNIVNFGHAGDGNIHVNIMLDGNDKNQVEKAEQAVEEIFRETLELGGTLSGEHGIGITKSPYISMEMGSSGVEMIQRVKRAFDPNLCLNPGKIIPWD